MTYNRNFATSLASACALMAMLAGCGSSESDDAPAAPTTYQYIARPSSYAGLPDTFLPTVTAKRNTDSTVQFVGYIGLQRYSSGQDPLVQPPFRLTFRFYNPATNAVYGVQTSVRGAPRTTDSLDGSADKNGVWYYPNNYGTGLNIPAGTNVQVQIVDDGDRSPGTGDELNANNIRLWVGAPLTQGDNSQPIIITTIVVPGAG